MASRFRVVGEAEGKNSFFPAGYERRPRDPDFCSIAAAIPHERHSIVAGKGRTGVKKPRPPNGAPMYRVEPERT
jgi:hypothetical protein